MAVDLFTLSLSPSGETFLVERSGWTKSCATLEEARIAAGVSELSETDAEPNVWRSDDDPTLTITRYSYPWLGTYEEDYAGVGVPVVTDRVA
jgi:hypothetical protein